MDTTAQWEDGVGPDIALATPGFYLRPDYHEVLAWLRQHAPVFTTADGLVALSRYEDVRDVSRDPERFVSGGGVLINDPLRDAGSGGLGAFSILHLDPPLHAAYRSVVNRLFTPRSVAPLEARIRTVVGRALDAVADDTPIDLVDALAAPIPMAVIAELLGVDGSDGEQLRRWSDATIEAADVSRGEQAAMMRELLGFLAEHVRSSASDPDGMLGVLTTTPVGDRLLDEGEIVGFLLTLLVAGNETTRTLLSGGAEALARHPEQQEALAGDPTLLAPAVEEMLRWVTPIQAFGRTAAVDVVLADRDLPAGTFVVMLYASANRDESVHGPDAGRFDVRRRPVAPHLTFGFGEHSCLGASLARLEARVFFEELLARHPRFRLAGEPTYTRSTLVGGARTLPIALAG
jgi:cytochrome P450